MTDCSRPECRQPGRVVLFARAGLFDKVLYADGQTIVFCLMHGGQVYDAIAAERTGKAVETPTWLLGQLGVLPSVRARYHTVTRAGRAPSKYGAKR